MQMTLYGRLDTHMQLKKEKVKGTKKVKIIGLFFTISLYSTHYPDSPAYGSNSLSLPRFVVILEADVIINITSKVADECT